MIFRFWSARCLGIGYFSGLVSWYYTVLASDYVTIEEALSGPVVATDWRAQKDVNSALVWLTSYLYYLSFDFPIRCYSYFCFSTFLVLYA